MFCGFIIHYKLFLLVYFWYQQFSNWNWSGNNVCYSCNYSNNFYFNQHCIGTQITWDHIWICLRCEGTLKIGIIEKQKKNIETILLKHGCLLWDIVSNLCVHTSSYNIIIWWKDFNLFWSHCNRHTSLFLDIQISSYNQKLINCIWRLLLTIYKFTNLVLCNISFWCVVAHTFSLSEQYLRIILIFCSRCSWFGIICVHYWCYRFIIIFHSLTQ